MQRASSIHLRNPLVLCKNVSRKKIWTFGFMNWAHHLQIQWQWYDRRIIRCNKSTRQSMRSYNALSALTVISAQSCIVTAAQWNLEKMVAWQGTAPIMFSAIVCYSRVFFTTKHQICHMLFKWSIGPCDSKSKKRHSWLIHSLMDCLDGSPYLTWSMHKIWEHKEYFCILSSWTSFIYPPKKKNWFKSHTWCMWYTIFHTHIQSRAQMVQFLSHCTYRSLYARTYSVSGFPLIKHMRVRTYAWKEAVFIQRCGMAHRFCVVSMSYWKAAAKTSLTVVVPKYSGYDACPDKEGSWRQKVWILSNHVYAVET